MGKKKPKTKARTKRPVPGAQQSSNLYSKAIKALHQGDTATAERLLRTVLQASPRHAEALHELGVILQARQDNEPALEAFKAAAEIRPDVAHYHNSIGTTLLNMGELEAAATAILEALRLNPEFADAHSKLGSVLMASGNLDEAIFCFRKAISLNPMLARAYNNLGNALREKEDYRGALECYRKVLEIQPDQYAIFNNMAIALGHLERYEDAARSLIESLKYNPDSYEAYANLSDIFKMQGKLQEARQALQIAETLTAEKSRVSWNRSFIEFLLGNLQEGWRLYDYGLTTGARKPVDFGVPTWDGSPLAGKSIAISAEQGLGDELRFASCFPDVLAQAGHCIINCDQRLESLYARSFPTATIFPGRRPETRASWDTLPAIDLQIPAGSLPRYFRNTLDDFPKQPGYLIPDKARVSYWTEQLRSLGKTLKVGLLWRSAHITVERTRTYISSLSELTPLLEVPGITFINLQYDENAISEFTQMASDTEFSLHNFDEIDLKNDLDELSALLFSLDLVIGSGSATVSMAGALGVPSWRFTSKGYPGLLGTDYLPFYPTQTPFLQSTSGSWQTEIETMAEKLRELAHHGFNS